jgi:hypothetical protein
VTTSNCGLPALTWLRSATPLYGLTYSRPADNLSGRSFRGDAKYRFSRDFRRYRRSLDLWRLALDMQPGISSKVASGLKDAAGRKCRRTGMSIYPSRHFGNGTVYVCSNRSMPQISGVEDAIVGNLKFLLCGIDRFLSKCEDGLKMGWTCLQ